MLPEQSAKVSAKEKVYRLSYNNHSCSNVETLTLFYRTVITKNAPHFEEHFLLWVCFSRWYSAESYIGLLFADAL